MSDPDFSYTGYEMNWITQRRTRLWLLGSSLWLVLGLGLGAAQQPAPALPEAARVALTQGQQAATAALATYDVHYLDKPLWREAIDYGMTAQRLAPRTPRALPVYRAGLHDR